MIDEHLPVLLILAPLLASLVVVLVRRRGPALGIALAACWTVFAMAARLLSRVLAEGTVSYALGGWLAPWGIEYRVDVLSCAVILLVASIGAIVLTFAPASVAREVAQEQRYLFYAMYLLCLTGLLGIPMTGDLFNLFVFLEISSLSSYALIGLGHDRRALTAAFQYLILGTIGATFILIGVGLLYMMTGTLNMLDMSVRLGDVEVSRTVLVALAFFSVGVAIKMALFPMHLWLPNAYTYAPSVVTAFLAATATKVSVYILLRLVFTILGPNFKFQQEVLELILLPMALLGIYVASTVAIFQKNIKRMLAYSSVAQIGYIVLGISFASTAGLTAGIVHVFNHAMIKGALFLAMGCIALRLGSVRLEDMRGIGHRMPLTTFAWVLGGLGLIGVPVTVGFVSKWYLLIAALERGWWPVALLVLISSLLALAYIWRVVEVAYFQKPPENAPQLAEAPLSMLIPTYVLTAATLVFGVTTPLTVGVAERAAKGLLSDPPAFSVTAEDGR